MSSTNWRVMLLYANRTQECEFTQQYSKLAIVQMSGSIQVRFPASTEYGKPTHCSISLKRRILNGLLMSCNDKFSFHPVFSGTQTSWLTHTSTALFVVDLSAKHRIENFLKQLTTPTRQHSVCYLLKSKHLWNLRP